VARIIWMSDTPLRASGFGLATGEICKRLASLGHDILVLGWWSATEEKFSGIDVKPCPVNPTGVAAAIASYVADFRPDHLITLGDVPWLSFLAGAGIQGVLSGAGVRWLIYYPVDGVLADGSLPVPWIDVLSKADAAVTMSRFGLAATERSGVRATFIPHGCDTELFRPPADKDAAKRLFGYDGKFVILSDARNHRRKLIPRALDIVRGLNIPASKLVFHLHSNAEPQEDEESYRYNVNADIDLLGLDFVTGLRDGAPPASLGMAELAKLYAAADVHLLASFGEGFGLPTLQAASSGVVPIVPANSASTELVGSHGFAIPCNSASSDEYGINRPFVDRQQAASMLRALYLDPELLLARSLAARRFALNYSWDHAASLWDAILRKQLPKTLRSRRPGGVRPKPICVQLGKLNGPKAGEARPTGHDSSILPIPLIGIPTRLEIRGNPELAVSPPIILVEQSCRHKFGALENVFPGICIREIRASRKFSREDLGILINGTTLVVDPKGRIRPRLDLTCAVRGVNFLGKSEFWPAVKGRGLIMQVRRLLTDYALSDARVAAAGVHAPNIVARQGADSGVGMID
jgi:glycosyltransferase involved in cell wall biosynthesis